MKIYTDVVIERKKNKKLIHVPLDEFFEGTWLNLLDKSKYLEVSYNARKEELHVSNLFYSNVVDKLKENDRDGRNKLDETRRERNKED